MDGPDPLRLELRIWIPHDGEVRGPRPRVQLAKQRVAADFRLQLRNAAVRIVQVAEHDRVGGTRLLAGGLELAVTHAALLFFGADLRAGDPLHTVRALLHHAAAAHGDV